VILRAARVALDITHVDLAREAGVSKRTLVRLETPQIVSEDSPARLQRRSKRKGWNSFRQKAGKGQGFGDQSRRSRNRQSAGAIDLLSSVSMLRLSAPMPL